VSQDKAPPPISGGTLLVAKDDVTAVVADPDRDVVFLVDLEAGKKTAEVALRPNDEPGRVVEDGARRAHVALRRGGAVVTIDLATGKETARREVCPAPRGIAWEAATDNLLVACAGGELVTLPAASGAPTRTVHLGRDLRDVVVLNDKIWVSRFRSAQLLQIGADGSVLSQLKPSDRFSKPEGRMSPAVAWRTIAAGTTMMMVHQVGKDDPIDTKPGGYGGGGACGGIVQGVLTTFDSTGPSKQPVGFMMGVLPVDVAFDAKGSQIAIVTPGNAKNKLPQIIFTKPTDVGDCFGGGGDMFDGQATAVAFRADGALVVQSREPAFVAINKTGTYTKIALSDVSRADTGHDVFHANSGNGIACASCHPEGGDDARTWNFAGLGPRRTQTFRGGLIGSEPFHWDGDMKDLGTLMTKVFVGRMSGPPLREDQLGALQKWVDRIPELPKSPARDAAAAARGQALFTDSTVACSGCHSGPRLGSNATVDVGTGGAMQVPSLRGISFRAPFLHTGCAATLTDRFGTCGGGDQHGTTSHLSAAQLADLVAYLETL